ncbi:phosphopantothenate--cysteine ligase isoform X2 [Salvelinus fontinalis]|uniref:phosphopantothenate--cysteine ligase isoform X2 n=1 Tax=Salvelinus fontinalis TaxID=8038 RepID=UPI0024856A67|nr:phosphopantothenate--cysteine ligase isoform X2 [Salvelinus fontinalis]
MADPRTLTAEGKLSEEFAVPSHVEEVKGQMAAFAVQHRAAGHRVVLITSGGTKVPLESRTVRFLDNFSSGRRGASSAEYFLESGYAVIFLHRHRSLYPFTRLYSGINLLDSLQLESGKGGSVSDQVVVNQQALPNIGKILMRYQAVKEAGLLLPVEFSTLSEYLHLLKAAAQALSPIGSNAMFYLAAAVSDFYIPASDMPEHKIQSSNGPLQYEDGPQDVVATGEGLGSSSICDFFQAGDRPIHPAGQSSAGSVHLSAPGCGSQCTGYQTRLRSGGDP